MKWQNFKKRSTWQFKSWNQNIKLQTNSTCSTTNYITQIESLKRELDIKERMITQLLNTVKEISTVTITGSAKPICTCENEARGNNISDIKTNQSEREKRRHHLQWQYSNE